MKKLLIPLITFILVILLAVGFFTFRSTNSSNQSSSTTKTTTSSTAKSSIGQVNNALAEDEDALISDTTSKFKQVDYTDEETGKTITYNVYLPEDYDENKEYPTVVFIGDSSTTGDDATKSLTQGLGANVWASDDWQSVNEAIVLVPSYPETILDDHGSYTTTEYVELTKRFIDYASEKYAVDTDRIYGTGQSMGAMTTLLLASQYTDLYAGIMIVDGQWDISKLSGLEGQNIVYFAAEDDENAWTGMQEVMDMYDKDDESYTYAQWDGSWTPDQLSQAGKKLTANGNKAYFISWKSGSIEADNSGMGGSSAYHMASFDYAYRSIAMMEWLFQQEK
ncbi:carboxylesterase family protein [Streptococcus caviae]|uniref:carboxylesterase family protein n=1 Tax=Streptococcus sp. 'caviae' TaxID=1915004 RepID=UPI00094BC133|nr:alpha/beta hydrolase-fold protein [Streptococcus sp. 'caviae']OLN82328.1 hypothetical protein BMI76_09545 [Streptococcus sp. 'caviae']